MTDANVRLLLVVVLILVLILVALRVVNLLLTLLHRTLAWLTRS